MLQNTRIGDVDREEYTCPFNNSHVIIASRFSNHILKCAKSYPDSKKKCIFNNDHFISAGEFDNHLENCPDRMKFFSMYMKVGNSECPVKNKVPVHIDVPEAEENWDDQPVVPSPLDSIQEAIKNKPVVRTLGRIGLTPSERKAFDAAERKRLQKLEEQNARNSAAAPVAVNPPKNASLPKQTTKSGSKGELRVPKSSRQQNTAIDELSSAFSGQRLTDGGTKRDKSASGLQNLSAFDNTSYFEESYMGGYNQPSAGNQQSSGTPVKLHHYDDDDYYSYDAADHDVNDDDFMKTLSQRTGSQVPPRWMRGRDQNSNPEVPPKPVQISGSRDQKSKSHDLGSAVETNKSTPSSSSSAAVASSSASSSSSSSASANGVARAKKQPKNKMFEIDEDGFLIQPILTKVSGNRKN